MFAGRPRKQVVEKRTKTSNPVIPAKAGIQDVDESNDITDPTTE